MLIYPALVLANVMSLGGHQSGPAPPLLSLASRAFLCGSCAYPVIYLPCAALALSSMRRDTGEAALHFAMVPLGYLLLLAGLFTAWWAIG